LNPTVQYLLFDFTSEGLTITATSVDPPHTYCARIIIMKRSLKGGPLVHFLAEKPLEYMVASTRMEMRL